MIEIDFYIRNFKYFLMFLIVNLFLSNHSLYSQSYHVRNYLEDDGLANSIVYGITQDHSGCMWFTTRNGISVYDGIRWKTYYNSHGLPIAIYSKIKCDRKGTIWALSNSSNLVTYFKGDKWSLLPKPIFLHPEEKISSFEVAEINNQTSVALGTITSGLYVWTNTENKWKNINSQNGLRDSSINDIAAYNQGFYIASDSGLSVLMPDNDKIDNTINDLLDLPSPEVIGIAVEKKNDSSPTSRENNTIWLLGKEWIGYLENGIFRVVSNSIVIPRNDFDVFLQPDNQHGLFYGNRYGIFFIDKDSGGVRTFGEEQGLVTGGATDAYIDREKNIWFSTLRGVSKIISMRFANYRQLHGLLSDETTAVWEIEPGHMVFGHNDGITFFKNNQFRPMVLSRNDIKNNLYSRVMDIRGDQEGNIWVAASDLGVAKIDKNKNIRWYSTKEGLTGMVNSVLIDKSEKIWAGTNNGVFILQGNTFIKTGTEIDRNPIHTRRLFLGSDDSIYVATLSDGVYLLNLKKNECIHFFHAEDRNANSIYAMLIDRRGKIWIGSRGGLYVLESDTPLKFNKEGFQINRPVYFIIEDDKNHLWFGTDNGVVKWDGQAWKEYTVDQGLAGRETNRAAGFIDSQGRVWIGMDRGLSCYREEFEKKDVPPPTVELLFLNVSGKQMPLKKVNQLKYNMNNLVFHFRAISFIDEDAICFQTKLEGFDHEWSSERVLNEGQVRYTNLSPRRYKFYLRAKNAEGVWSAVISSADIIIQSPFWSKWWLYILLLLILGFGFYSIQDYFSKKRYASLLESQVHEKTEELRIYHQHLEEMVEKRTSELKNANIQLKKEINERMEAEKVLQEQRNQLKTIFAVTPDLLVLLDRDFVYQAVNPAFCQFMGKQEEELIGKTDFEVFPRDKAEIYRQSDIEVMESGKLHILERQAFSADGKEKWLQVAKAPILDPTGKSTGILVSVRDITELKKMEEQIKASLREKEVLLREIHHRVKNNLQTIVSLLSLQSGYSKDKQVLEVFKNSQERVRAMALIHEKLYESRDLSQIDFQEYIHSLVAHLFESYSLRSDLVQLKMQIEDVTLDIDTAIPLGLLISELVSNSVKHAFPHHRKGELRINLSESEDEEYDYTLIIEDNGVGFSGGPDFQDSKTLGMVLISSLVKKLKGIMALDRKNGTRFTIKFKKLKYKKRIEL